MYEAVESRRHEAFILGASGLSDKLRWFKQLNGQAYVIFVILPAEFHTEHFVSLSWWSLNAARTRFQQINEPSTHLCWIDFWKTLPVLCFYGLQEEHRSAVATSGKCYLVPALLTNFHTCLYGSQMSNFFDLQPPALEAYLLNHL